MSMIHNKNIINQSKIFTLTLEELAKHSSVELQATYADLSSKLDRLRTTKAWLELAIASKYDEQITAKRIELNKHSGIVQIEDGGVRVSHTVKEEVTWQQSSLESIVREIIKLGYSPNQFIEMSYTVPEHKYCNYPQSVLHILLPSRKVHLTKPVYKLSLL